jgi:hypothetical protein
VRSQAPDEVQVFDLVEVLKPPAPPIDQRGRRGRRAEGALARAEAAARGVSDARVPLVEVPTKRRPHVQLGVLWAGISGLAAWSGRPALGIWFGLAAGVAGAQIGRQWRKSGSAVRPIVPMLCAAAVPIAAIGGADTMAPALAAIAAVILLPALASRGRSGMEGAMATLVSALAPGLAAAGPVLARGLGRGPALALLAFAFAYDAGSYIVGSRSGWTWEGAAAGAIAIIPVTVVVATIAVFPAGSPSSSPWVLGAVAALLAPAGPIAARAVLPPNANEPPGLGRLDVLLVLGPVWAYTAAALLH